MIILKRFMRILISNILFILMYIKRQTNEYPKTKTKGIIIKLWLKSNINSEITTTENPIKYGKIVLLVFNSAWEILSNKPVVTLKNSTNAPIIVYWYDS